MTLLIAMLLTSLPAMHVANAAPPAKDHPVLGSWTMTSKDGSCSEVYRFQPDGIVFVTSGDEVAEIASDISAAPSRKGFYRWTQRVAKDNGKPDCSGKITRAGEAFSWFIQFDRTGQLMIVCKAETTDACFGPLHRVRGGDS